MAENLPFLEKMDGRVPISVEILPPNRGLGLESIHNFFDGLEPWKPAFVSVTYHQAFKVEENDVRIWNRKKPGTIGVCAMLKFQYGFKVIPHVICGGFSTFESEDFLVDLDYLGLDTILALRGDPKKGDDSFKPHRDGHEFASGLVTQIMGLNRGEYMEMIKEPRSTGFTVGVAGYPEVHKEAASAEEDILNLKKKVDAGASFIITQMFFDNRHYIDFVERCRSAGIDVPIIPGLKVITNRRQVEILPNIFNTSIPAHLTEEILACADDDAARKIGLQHTLDQIAGLKEVNAPGIHIFSMNNLEVMKELLLSIP